MPSAPARPCRYGAGCYRTSAHHRTEFSHPPAETTPTPPVPEPRGGGGGGEGGGGRALVETLVDLRLSQLASVRRSFAVLDGRVWGWGENMQGAAGHTGDGSRVPRPVPFVHSIRQIAVGNQHTLFLTDQHTVFVCGSNQFGQLGCGRTPAFIQTPTALADLAVSPPAIIAVTAGIAGSSALLDKSGVAHTCGELHGRGASVDHARFLPIDASTFDGPLSQVALGGCLSVFLTRQGKVFTSGYDSNTDASGILGQGPEVKRACLVPKPLQLLWDAGTRGRFIAAGRFHGAVVDGEGRILTWGGNAAGQLGLGDHGAKAHRSTPTRVPGLSGVVHASCGWQHTLAVTEAGEVYSWGRGGQGQLGRLAEDALDKPSSTPAVVVLPSDHSAVAAYAGDAHSLVVLSTQLQSKHEPLVVASFGLNREGQLGGGLVKSIANKCNKFICRLQPAVISMTDHATQATPAASAGGGSFSAASDRDSGHGDDGSGGGGDDGSEKRRKIARTCAIGGGSIGAGESSKDSTMAMSDEVAVNPLDDAVSARLDYSDVDCSSATPLPSMSTILERVNTCDDVRQASPDTPLDLLVCNHYGLAALTPLGQSLAAPSLSDRLVGLTFVSCSLGMEEAGFKMLQAGLQACSRLYTFTLDSSSLHTNATDENGDDSALGRLAEVVLGLPSLRELSLDSVGDVCVTHIAKAIPASRIHSLTLPGASLSSIGFSKLASTLKNPAVSLHTLRLMECSTMSDAGAKALASGLSVNASLTCLDMHVTELGQAGVQVDGVQSIVEALEDNSASRLGDLDLSGDDGSPEIPAELQARLTVCLQRNAHRLEDPSAADRPVWQSGEEC